jgi:hypothetical protein
MGFLKKSIIFNIYSVDLSKLPSLSRYSVEYHRNHNELNQPPHLKSKAHCSMGEIHI